MDTLFPYTTLFRSQHGAGDRIETRPGRGQRLIGEGADDVQAVVRLDRSRRLHPQAGAVDHPQPQRVVPVQQRLQHGQRSEEHTSELQSLMRISYAVFCLKKKKTNKYY